MVLSDSHGLIGTAPGALFQTDDGGVTWVGCGGLPTGDELFPGRPVFADPDHGWVTITRSTGAPDDGLYATTDGGRTWTHQAV